MDAAVRDQALERQSGDLAAVGVVGRDEDGLGRVVDDEVDPGVQLEYPGQIKVTVIRESRAVEFAK